MNKNIFKKTYLFYIGIAILVLFPILIKSGYIFTLDLVLTPKIAFPTVINNGFLLDYSLYLLNFVIPSYIIEKILFFLIIILSGIGIHQLIPIKNNLPKYFAGTLYIINPFTYSRFLAGHTALLLAYALIPFAIKTIFNFFKNTNWQNTLKLSLWFSIIIVSCLHGIYFVSLIFFVSFLFFTTKNNFLKLLRYTVLIFFIFVLLNSYWIAPTFFKKNNLVQFTNNIEKADLFLFQTAADEKYSVWINTAAMNGFWVDRELQYIPSKQGNPFWLPIFLVILGLSFWGIYSVKDEKTKKIAELFFLLGCIALVLAVGVSFKPFQPLILYLFDHSFIVRGFREPQKFVSLLCLSYAFLGALGLDDLSKRINAIYMPLFLIIPFIYCPLMLNGFAGQMVVTNYPESWYKTNQILNTDTKDFRVLFFPWHQYITFNFIDKNIVNPAPFFFNKTILSSLERESGAVYISLNDPDNEYIKRILREKDFMSNAGERFAKLNIKYIILAKEVDYKNYLFLNNQQDLKIIYSADDLILYKNLKFAD